MRIKVNQRVNRRVNRRWKVPNWRVRLLDQLMLSWSTSRHIDGLWIGTDESDKSDLVLRRVEEALCLIKTHDPHRFHRLRRDLDRLWVRSVVPGANAKFNIALHSCELGRRYVLDEAARSIPIQRRASTTSPACFGTKATLPGARPLLERALAIDEKVFGRDHPGTAPDLSNLARLLHDMGRSNEGESYFGRAMAIAEKAHGPGHPDTHRYRSHYARLRLGTGRATETLALGEAALAIHEASSGVNHPWTKASARVTADALDVLGRTKEAAALRARLLAADTEAQLARPEPTGL
ncbi:MAG TPA: tetratricopeptide repeat protein [Xanthobacteraceae bacterium]